jgi:hypothetical protein
MIKIFFLLLISSNIFAQCEINKTVDKFENKQNYHVGLLDKISFSKFVNNGKQDIFLVVSSSGPSVHSGQGVYLLLKDGTKIIHEETPVKVKANVDKLFGGFDFVYMSALHLNNLEIEQLSKSPITDFKLYIYDDTLKTELQNSDTLLKCVVEAK